MQHDPSNLRALLESLHHEFHQPHYLTSDPLQFAHRYANPADREVVALIAASFAFGNVKSICDTLEGILKPLGSNPSVALATWTPSESKRHYRGFVYRWVRAADLRVYLAWIGATLRAHGSLGALWQSLDDPAHPTILPTLQKWVDTITSQPTPGLSPTRRLLRREGSRPAPLPSGAHVLLTAPDKKSTCKRMNMFLRWVCRPADGIDLGLWPVSPSRLIMPVDTHVLQCAKMMNLTTRTAADLRTAIEITESLRRIDPDDPCRFDFSMTRPGIMKLKERLR